MTKPKVEKCGPTDSRVRSIRALAFGVIAAILGSGMCGPATAQDSSTADFMSAIDGCLAWVDGGFDTEHAFEETDVFLPGQAGLFGAVRFNHRSGTVHVNIAEYLEGGECLIVFSQPDLSTDTANALTTRLEEFVLSRRAHRTEPTEYIFCDDVPGRFAYGGVSDEFVAVFTFGSEANHAQAEATCDG